MKKLSLILPFMFILTILSSCIKDGEADCNTQFRLLFDYNILGADAINKQIDFAQIYLFKEDKQLAYVLEQSVNPNEERCIITTARVAPGKYYAVGVGQDHRITAKGHNFIVPNLTYESALLDHLNARIPLEPDRSSSREINNFLIGTATSSLESNDATLLEIVPNGSYTIPLKKVTNKVRIVLLDKSLKPKDDYSLSLYETKGNGWINYNFMSKPDDPIVYHPYLAGIKEVDRIDNGNLDEYKEAYVAEFSSSKLISTHPTLLDIKDESGKNSLKQINILPLLELGMIEEYGEKWSFQEYLDRKDNFVISLFMDGSTWLEGQVIVNGWIISLNEIEI